MEKPGSVSKHSSPSCTASCRGMSSGSESEEEDASKAAKNIVKNWVGDTQDTNENASLVAVSTNPRFARYFIFFCL
jgi:hypothetical protein